MDSFKLGPLVFSTSLVVLFAAIALVFTLAKKIAHKSDANVEKPLWLILLGGLLTGRIVFVMMYHEQYLAVPWTILDIRDGGFNAIAALAAVVFLTASLALYKSSWRKPLLVSVTAGVVLWSGLTVLLLGSDSKAQRVPQIALPNLEQQPVQINALGAKPMIINLWASWCPPCHREMPVLQDAQRGNQDIIFVFVNQGEDAETVKRYLATENLQLDNVLLDRQGILPKEVGSVGMPTTLFFDSSGKLVDKRVGEFSAATLAHKMAALRDK